MLHHVKWNYSLNDGLCVLLHPIIIGFFNVFPNTNLYYEIQDYEQFSNIGCYQRNERSEEY